MSAARQQTFARLRIPVRYLANLLTAGAETPIVTALVVVVAACGDGPAPTKYTQTWAKPYSTTTCADWRDAMGEHQKFVMAADILLTSQRKLKADAPIPSDQLIGQFQGQIQGLCLTYPTDEVSTAAYIVWTTGSDVFAPE